MIHHHQHQPGIVFVYLCRGSSSCQEQQTLPETTQGPQYSQTGIQQNTHRITDTFLFIFTEEQDRHTGSLSVSQAELIKTGYLLYFNGLLYTIPIPTVQYRPEECIGVWSESLILTLS